MRERGLLRRESSMVDATIINAPRSTKNKDKARDPEMYKTKKSNQWYHDMKTHSGADSDSGLVLKGMAEGVLKELTQAREKITIQILARVEHPFHIVKNLFKHKNTHCRSLTKNVEQLNVMLGLANLVIM